MVMAMALFLQKQVNALEKRLSDLSGLSKGGKPDG
jgi:hypothetical protein